MREASLIFSHARESSEFGSFKEFFKIMCLPSEAVILSKGVHAGFEWMVIHNGFGFRCGYVLIPKGHVWHQKDYGEIGVTTVHGGLTFSKSEPLV